MSKEPSKFWERASEGLRLGDQEIESPLQLTPGWNESWIRDPKSILFILARYKFVMKMLKTTDTVLEVGCGEGIGAQMISTRCSHYHGLDRHEKKIMRASEKAIGNQSFKTHDILDCTYPEKFDVVFSLDVIEHVYPEGQSLFIDNLCSSIKSGGMLIIGSPSLESQEYASTISKAGHVGCMSAETQHQLVANRCTRVLSFSMNDEVVHTGFSRMSNYNLTIGFYV
jgi:2-polyprenyl-3-methyl-5-hydroxy-6-metoxy-1,4-benzoquinol methylase